jgi:hypothetical protein
VLARAAAAAKILSIAEYFNEFQFIYGGEGGAEFV